MIGAHCRREEEPVTNGGGLLDEEPERLRARRPRGDVRNRPRVRRCRTGHELLTLRLFERQLVVHVLHAARCLESHPRLRLPRRRTAKVRGEVPDVRASVGRDPLALRAEIGSLGEALQQTFDAIGEVEAEIGSVLQPAQRAPIRVHAADEALHALGHGALEDVARCEAGVPHQRLA